MYLMQYTSRLVLLFEILNVNFIHCTAYYTNVILHQEVMYRSCMYFFFAYLPQLHVSDRQLNFNIIIAFIEGMCPHKQWMNPLKIYSVGLGQTIG